jgi:predicted PurR-regulated permease PerM
MTTPASPGPARRPTAARGLVGRLRARSPAGGVILLLAALLLILAAAVLYLARPVLVPLAIAGLLQFVLAPIVRRIRGLGIPAPLAAGALLLALLAGAGAAFYHLSTPALAWVDELQDKFWLIEWRLADLREPFEGVARASRRVEEITAANGAGGDVVQVRSQSADPVRVLLAHVLELGTSFLLILFLLFFLLARDGVLLQKLPKLVRDPVARERFKEVYITVEREVSTYLLTISAINAGLGVAIGTAMFLLGVPNPILWGAMACLLNFIPYLGGLVGVGIILVVSLISDQVNPLLPPLMYLLVNGTEGMLITPMILGRMLTLSPVAVFLWLILSAWLWGIPGALLAVPLLAVVKLVADKVPALSPLAHLLDR